VVAGKVRVDNVEGKRALQRKGDSAERKGVLFLKS